MFTSNQIEEIRKKLQLGGVKDTQFPQAEALKGDEILTIVQNRLNRQLSLKDFIEKIGVYTFSDFLNISKSSEDSYTLEEAIALVSPISRKAGQVITFMDSSTGDWAIYQFKGKTASEWFNTELWDNILAKVDSHFKGWFLNECLLNTYYPRPMVGDFAFIGNTLEEGIVYMCIKYGEWYNTKKRALDFVDKWLQDNIPSIVEEYIKNNEIKIDIDVDDALSTESTNPVQNKIITEALNKINVPTKVSELENDSNYQSAEQVEQKINDLVNSAPEALDTLKELADALNSDPNFATTVTNQLSNKADKTELDKYLLKSGGEITGAIYSGSKTSLVNDNGDDLLIAIGKFISREEGYTDGNIATYFTSTFQIIPGEGVVIVDVENAYSANLSIYIKNQIYIYKLIQDYSGGNRTLKSIKIGCFDNTFGISNDNNNPNFLFATDGSVTTLKTINGQSIFGEGNVEINSDNVYVIDYMLSSEGTITEEQYNTIKDAIINNKIIVLKTILDGIDIIIPCVSTIYDRKIEITYNLGINGYSILIGRDDTVCRYVQYKIPSSNGSMGQVLTITEDGYDWKDPQVGDAFPEGGEEGQVLKKTADGVEWADDNDTKVTVNNTLESDSTTEALSAAQGKALNEKIEALEIPEEYTLPTATISQLGGVKIGEGITVKSDGTISAADDVISLTNLYAAKGDIAAMCAAGPFITNLYFINSPVTEGITAGIDTGDYYHLCVMKSGTSNYLETTCSNVADTFSSFDNMDDYFVITNTVLYLKNNVIYHVTGGTDAGYFVSNEKGDTLTNVASRFETLAEARAYMREKMLALPDISIVKCTSEEYEGSVKDENTLYIIHG